MTLGPGKLQKGPIRSILKTPRFKIAADLFKTGAVDWSHASLKDLKTQIRLELRKQQGERCIYCRRPLIIERKNVCEDLEHFLDKSKPHFRKWAFCCVNISLSCHACNFQKSTKNLGIGLVPPAGTTLYLSGPGQYSWIHPFFDDFHEHVQVGKGWTYQVKAATAPFPALAQAMITDLDLVKVATIEARAEQIKSEILRLTNLGMECLNRNRPRHAKIAMKASKALQEATTFG